jgi:hypothetical protein
LLGQLVPLDPRETLIHAAFNAAVALPLFMILDRMKLSGELTASGR